MEPVDDTGQLSSEQRLCIQQGSSTVTRILGEQYTHNWLSALLISSLSSGNFCFIQKTHKDAISASVVLFTEIWIHLHTDLMVLTVGQLQYFSIDHNSMFSQEITHTIKCIAIIHCDD